MVLMGFLGFSGGECRSGFFWVLIFQKTHPPPLRYGGYLRGVPFRGIGYNHLVNTAPACLLIGLGAILAFAVTNHHWSGLDIHAVGIILIGTGILGLVLNYSKSLQDVRSRLIIRTRPRKYVRVDPPELHELHPGDITEARETEDYLN